MIEERELASNPRTSWGRWSGPGAALESRIRVVAMHDTVRAGAKACALS